MSLIQIPYDCLNRIFDYLSQNLDAKWRLVIDDKGRVHLRINKYASLYTTIQSMFDCGVGSNMEARASSLRIFRGENTEPVVVDAWEHPRRLTSQPVIDLNRETFGFIDYGWCYSYENPETGVSEYAYVEARYYISSQRGEFIRGTVYRDGATYNVDSFNVVANVASIYIQQVDMEWNPPDEDELDAVEALLMLEDEGIF